MTSRLNPLEDPPQHAPRPFIIQRPETGSRTTLSLSWPKKLDVFLRDVKNIAENRSTVELFACSFEKIATTNQKDLPAEISH